MSHQIMITPEEVYKAVWCDRWKNINLIRPLFPEDERMTLVEFLRLRVAAPDRLWVLSEFMTDSDFKHIVPNSLREKLEEAHAGDLDDLNDHPYDLLENDFDMATHEDHDVSGGNFTIAFVKACDELLGTLVEVILEWEAA